MYTIIIVTGELKNSKTKLENDQIIFEPKVLSYEHMNGDKRLYELKNKIDNKEKLTQTNRLDLIFIPFMKSKNSIITQIREVIELTNRIDYINNKEKNNIKLSQYILINQHIKNPKTKEKLKRMINMENSIFDDFFDDAIEIGEKKGIKKEKENVAKNLIKLNLETEKISEATGLTTTQIEELK